MPPFSGTPTEGELRDWLERLRWPNGLVCPHCRWQATAAMPKRDVHRCRAAGCRRSFTVTVGTVLERTHHSLTVWWEAVNYLTNREKGLSVRQLQSLLALPYRSTWSIMERLRKIAPKQKGMFTLAPLTNEEVFIRLMARPAVLPEERFARLERQARKLDALAARAARKTQPKQ